MSLTPPAFNVQGHRGARGLKPENTLPSFEVALDLEVDTLELDLHLTRDDVVVVWHDPILVADKCRGPGLTARDPGAPARSDPDLETARGPAIRSLTLAELTRYRCDQNPDPGRFPAQNHLPTELARDHYGIVSFAELLEFVDAYARSPQKTSAQRRAAARVRFNFETKRDPAHPEYIGDDFDGENPGTLETLVVDLVRAHGVLARSVLQCFDFRSLWAARKHEPALALTALTEHGVPDLTGLAQHGVSCWSPNAADLTADAVPAAHALGLTVVAWTVNDVEHMRALIALGVDGLISDRPDLLLAVAREHGRAP